MGMSITVGVAPVEPGSTVENDLAEINRELIETGLGEHREAERVPDDAQWTAEDLPYTFLDRLQRVQAWVNQGLGLPEPLEDGRQARDDPAIATEYDALSSHLVLHNPVGWFVPVDFDEPLIIESVTGKIIGSSQRLLDELIESGDALGIERNGALISEQAIRSIQQEFSGNAPYAKEKLTWLALYDAARRSVAYGVAILHR